MTSSLTIALRFGEIIVMKLYELERVPYVGISNSSDKFKITSIILKQLQNRIILTQCYSIETALTVKLFKYSSYAHISNISVPQSS